MKKTLVGNISSETSQQNIPKFKISWECAHWVSQIFASPHVYKIVEYWFGVCKKKKRFHQAIKLANTDLTNNERQLHLSMLDYLALSKLHSDFQSWSPASRMWHRIWSPSLLPKVLHLGCSWRKLWQINMAPKIGVVLMPPVLALIAGGTPMMFSQI